MGEGPGGCSGRRATGFLANLGALQAEAGRTSTDGHLWQLVIITAMEM